MFGQAVFMLRYIKQTLGVISNFLTSLEFSVNNLDKFPVTKLTSASYLYSTIERDREPISSVVRAALIQYDPAYYITVKTSWSLS